MHQDGDCAFKSGSGDGGVSAATTTTAMSTAEKTVQKRKTLKLGKRLKDGGERQKKTTWREKKTATAVMVRQRWDRDGDCAFFYGGGDTATVIAAQRRR